MHTVNMNEQKNTRILAENVRVSNDTQMTGLNNNDLIIGPSGAGKTGGYVIPNIMECNSSIVVADTKGNLHRKLAPALLENGYKVHVIDFDDPEKSGGYNPLDYISINPRTGNYSEKDIISVTAALCPVVKPEDEFWYNSARSVIACMISFVLEAFPPQERNLCSVLRVFKMLCRQHADLPNGTGQIPFLEEWTLAHPESFAAKKYLSFKSCLSSDKTWGCITQFVSNPLEIFDLAEAEDMLKGKSSFRIEQLGEEKTVLFLHISDSDRAQDTLVNLFYTQALNALCKAADKNPDNRLAVPCRIILDDFATNAKIPNFDNLISVIRSREIYVSVILQSLTQLEGMYGYAKAMTIINNCDHWLFLGSTDRTTVNLISFRMNVSPDTIMTLPLDKVYVLERGKKGICTNKVKPYSTPLLTCKAEGSDYFKTIDIGDCI